MKRLLFLALVCTSAHAEFWSGNKLLSMMTGDNLDQLIAIGYVTGATDAYNGSQHCIPSSVTIGQSHDVVKQYLTNNPAVRNLTADTLVAAALGRIWPCASRNNNNRGGQSL